MSNNQGTDFFHDTILSLDYGKYSSTNISDHLRYCKKVIEDNWFSKDKDNFLAYNLIGNFDVLFLHEVQKPDSLHKTGNRLETDVILEGSFHNVSGLAFNSAINIDNFFKNAKNDSLVAVTELKLNTALLFTYDINLVTFIIDKWNKIIENKNINHKFIYSFSSYELILLQTGNDISLLNNNIMDLRHIAFSEEGIQSIKNNFTETDKKAKSINDIKIPTFYEIIDKNKKIHTKDFNIFSDTETAFGISISIPQKGEVLFNLKNTGINNTIQLEIEFKIKPGGESKLIEDLETLLEVKNKEEFRNNIKQMPGKEDLLLMGGISFEAYKKIFEANQQKISKENGQNGIFSSMRSIKSTLIFNYQPRPRLLSYGNKSHLENLSFKDEELANLKNKLAKYQFSYQAASQYLRMFTLYNSGILNTVLFSSFLELFPLLEYSLNFFSFIEDDTNISKIIKKNKNPIPSEALREFMDQIVQTFAIAHDVRRLNNIVNVEGSEVYVKYNSNFNNLISELNSYFHLINIYLKRKIYIHGKSNTQNISSILDPTILAIDYTETLTDVTLINLESSSIFHPGLFFNLMIKEAFMPLIKTAPLHDSFQILSVAIAEEIAENAEILKKRGSLFSKQEIARDSAPVDDYYYETNIKDIFIDYIEDLGNYLIIDLWRYEIFFKSKMEESFKTFAFWHLATVTQSYTQYNEDSTYIVENCHFECARLVNIYFYSKKDEWPDRKKSIEELISLIPFKEDIEGYQQKNFSIWKNSMILQIDFFYTLLKNKIRRQAFYDLLCDNLSAYNFVGSPKNDLKSTVINDFKDHINLVKLSDSIENIISKYLNDMAKYFNFTVIACSKYKEMKNNEEDDKWLDQYNDGVLLSDTRGGFIFKNLHMQKDYNRKNMALIPYLSTLAYKHKLIMFEIILSKRKGVQN